MGAGLADQRVLVTGGAGVIARELLDLLAAGGATVLSVDRLPLDLRCLGWSPQPTLEHDLARLVAHEEDL